MYILLKLTVYNNGNESVTINDGSFKVFINDSYYDHDPVTTSYHDGGFFLEKINPGMQKTATIVYEIPKSIPDGSSMGLEIAHNKFKDQYGWFAFVTRAEQQQ